MVTLKKNSDIFTYFKKLLSGQTTSCSIHTEPIDLTPPLKWLVKAKFHYAIQLASWSQTRSRTSSRAR